MSENVQKPAETADAIAALPPGKAANYLISVNEESSMRVNDRGDILVFLGSKLIRSI